jgi:hypothetical protein
MGLALAILFGSAMGVGATRFAENRIAAGEVIEDDVIIGGDSVVVDGTILGDLIASGSDVTVNGTVQGSVVAMGANVTVNGTVQGSVYAAASSVTLGAGANIGRNAYLAGYSVQSLSGAQVRRDLMAAGYQALLSGDVGQDLRAGAGAVELRGAVGRDVVVSVASPGETGMAPMMLGNPRYRGPQAVPSGLRVYPEASVGGDLRYKSTVRQDDAIRARPEGDVVFILDTRNQDTRTTQPAGWRGLALMALRWLGRLVRDLVTLLIVGALAIWKLPSLLDDLAAHLSAKPWPSLGWGFIAWVVGYAAAAVLFGVIVAIGLLLALVTLGGLASTWFGLGLGTLGVAFTAFLFLVSLGSKVVAANWLGKVLFGARYTGSAYWPLVVGVLIYVALCSIPILGWVIGLAATAYGLGAMWPAARERGWLGKTA